MFRRKDEDKLFKLALRSKVWNYLRFRNYSTNGINGIFIRNRKLTLIRNFLLFTQNIMTSTDNVQLFKFFIKNSGKILSNLNSTE